MYMRLFNRPRYSESGNIFLAIFGAVALVGLLGASIMTFMKGPLSTSIKLTKINTAENQMAIGSQVAVMAAANQANSGDCDGDGTIEPVEWRTPTTEPVPTGGGLVPLSLGISKKDPWGTEYGYCVWNYGSITTQAGTCGANMLQGNAGTAYPVVALISAGPDKTFTTTCRNFGVADANHNGTLDSGELPLVGKAAETDDDIITSYTYEEATGVSGGLWSLKAGSPGTAVINKNIETSGVANLKGGVLLPDKSLVTCDASTAGVMAKNGTTGIEICDGAGTWTAITGGGVAGNNLVLTPNVSTGMNVTGGCGASTCYSTNVTFTLTNKAATTSPVLATSLSNTTNFEFVSNGCTGAAVAPNATCQMVVRAKASGNVSYAGVLQVTGGNSPLATLDGTASGFAGCNAGGQGPGGYYVACGVSGSYNLIVTPSGCSAGNTNPTCPGGADTLQLYNHSVSLSNSNLNSIGGAVSYTGQQNTANLMAYSGGAYSFPAASWCDGLVYGGYDDWFLPNLSEVSYFYNNRTAVGAATGDYWTSTDHNWYYGEWKVVNFTGGAVSYGGGPQNKYVRCMRRDPAATVSPIVDTTPLLLSFSPSYGAANVTRTSNAQTIYGVTQPINVSVSGGTNAKFSKNGGAYTSTPTTVTNGDQITLQATSPVGGQESIVTLTVGSISANWLIRTPGNNTLRVFTSAGTYRGDNVTTVNCNSLASAAGLNGTWMPIAGSVGGDWNNTMPWNWTTLKNMNNQTVATSVTDFMDGTLSASMAFSQTGAPVSGSVWVGMNSSGNPHSSGAGAVCNSWSSNACGIQSTTADPLSTAGAGYLYDGAGWINCCNSNHIYCIETYAAGADLDPDDVAIRPTVTFASGGLATSNSVTVTGVTDVVNVSITPSAGTANIIKNGLSVSSTTTTAGLNDSLVFTLTAPTTLGTKNTATITIGPDTYTWWVGYGDSAKEARVFVTSTVNNSVGGLTGADSWCNSLAAASPYGLSASWKAMMSDSSRNMFDRVSWNWGTLKTLTGIIVVDNGFNDLFDGTLDNSINVDEKGNGFSGWVHTGSNNLGMRYNFANSTASSYWFNDWTSDMSGCGNGAAGGSSASVTSHFSQGTACYVSGRIYCIEDVDNTTLDTIPNTISLSYPVQVPTSSRQTSSSVMISGMSSGATTTLSVTATGGSPTFKINGGPEVASGTIRNGDSIVFLMDAPGTGNTFNKMTISAGGSTTIGYWRVWTGDTTGSVVKRVFVTNVLSITTNQGGVSGVDSVCQSKASSAGLGGTWKAIASGLGSDENQFAVNRIGYNWSTLRRIDGVDVVMAGNIWSTNTTPLLNPISVSQTSVTTSTSLVVTGTLADGTAAIKTSEGACRGFSMNNASSSSQYAYNGTSGSTSTSWVQNGTVSTPGGAVCGTDGLTYLYCIEQ